MMRAKYAPISLVGQRFGRVADGELERGHARHASGEQAAEQQHALGPRDLALASSSGLGRGRAGRRASCSSGAGRA